MRGLIVYRLLIGLLRLRRRRERRLFIGRVELVNAVVLVFAFHSIF